MADLTAAVVKSNSDVNRDGDDGGGQSSAETDDARASADA